MKPLLLTFDVEEFDLPSELGRPLALSRQLDVTQLGVEALLELLARHDVRATFFVTGRFAHARPRVVRAVAAAGHETAVHGLRHRDDYASMPPREAGRRLARARAIVESAAGRAAAGVRLPRLRACAPVLLHDAGFLYDATPHPTWVPGRYCGLAWGRSPWEEDRVVRVPISVLPAIRLPVSFVWFRYCAASLRHAAMRSAALGSPYLHLYFHPWEAQEIGRLGVPRWLAHGTGRRFIDSLEALLGWAAGHLRSITLEEYVREIRTAGCEEA